jgi:type I restriction enzyme S subunit
VRPNTNVLDLKYIYYYFCLESVKKYIRSIAVGATMPSINTKILSEVNITFPQLTEQRAISATLSCLDDMIELNNRTNQVLEEMAQSIYKQWFVDFDFPNEDGQPYKSSGGEMVDSELGEIPKGWRVLTINDLCSKLASGGTPSTKISLNYVGDINWFSTKELKDNFLITSEKKINQNAIKTSAAKLFPPSTILMAIYAAPTVGRLGILTEESAFNQAAVGFISNDSVTCMEYLYLTLLNERINLNNLANGAAQQNLNVGIVKNYKIICPDIKVTLDFKRIVNRLFNKIKNNTIEIKILKEIRDTLLPKLMSGEIRVPLEEVE